MWHIFKKNKFAIQLERNPYGICEEYIAVIRYMYLDVRN